MANPYESSEPSMDPFRERPTSPQQPQQQQPAAPAETTSYNIEIPVSMTSGGGGYGSASPPKFLEGASTNASPSAAGNGAASAGNQSGGEASPKPTSKFWRLEFYQQFFDVSTRQVLIRMSNTLVPLNPPDFLLDRRWHLSTDANDDAAGTEPQQGDLIVDGVTLSRKPDLYGPFWICTTLWMVLGIVSNIMSKIAATRANKKDWQYDFSVASVACVVMYMYCFVFGAVVWGIMAWKNLPATLVDTVCLYGYSMFIFILTALMCMIPVTAVQWIFCILGGLWSTAYLLVNFWHMWKTTLERNWFYGVVAFVSLFHFGLTLSFKFYFFHYSY